MKREALFHRTVEVLVNAYNEGKLEHGNCHACAVGNMIHAANGEVSGNWFNPVMGAQSVSGIDKDYCDRTTTRLEGLVNIPSGYAQIISTGYSLYEVALIEKAFEDAHTDDILHVRRGGKEGMHGLRAVYDVLLQMHEVEVETVAKAEEVFA